MSGGTTLASEWAAARTVARFFQHLDARDYRAAAGLFAENGTWLRMGERLEGPEGVASGLAARPAALATRHLVTNMVTEADGEAVRATYYATVFDDPAAGDDVAALDGPGAIFVCDDRLVETADGWRFAARVPRLVFRKR